MLTLTTWIELLVPDDHSEEFSVGTSSLAATTCRVRRSWNWQLARSINFDDFCHLTVDASTLKFELLTLETLLAFQPMYNLQP